MSESPNTDFLLNGNTRKATCTVDYKNALGVSATGYPKVYSFLTGFIDPVSGNYVSPITAVEMVRLTDAAYTDRVYKFYNYIESQNTGLDRNIHVVPGFGPSGNSPLCVINTEGLDDPNPIN